jgi:hypothetical protein
MKNLALYKLKQQRGKMARVRVPLTTELNLDTGVRETDFNEQAIKIIPMPEGSSRKFFKELAAMTGGVTPKHGGPFDIHTREFLIDIADLKGLVLTIDTQVIFKDTVYEVKDIATLDDLGAISLTVATGKAVPNEP